MRWFLGKVVWFLDTLGRFLSPGEELSSISVEEKYCERTARTSSHPEVQDWAMNVHRFSEKGE